MSDQLALDWALSPAPLTWFAPGDIEPWPGLNPRTRVSEEKIAELAGSIAEVGVLQNIVVQAPGNGGKHFIISGETRWLAARRVGAKLPARVVRLTEAQALTIAMIENLGRNDLTPMEEARGFRRLLDLEEGLTQEDLGKRLGLSQSHVANRISLLALPAGIQQLVDSGVIAWSLARDQLVKWTAEPEDLQRRFFSALITQINARPDTTEPVTRVWLTPLVEKLGAILRVPAGKQPAATPESKPAGGSKAESKTTAAAKPKTDDSQKTIRALETHDSAGTSFKSALARATLEQLQQVQKTVRRKVGQKRRTAALDKRIREVKAEQRKAAKKKPTATQSVESRAQAGSSNDVEKREQVELQPEPAEAEAVEVTVDSPQPVAGDNAEPRDESADGDKGTGIPAAEAVCIHCGCKDSEACIGGCSWTVVDRARGLGVCSNCEPAVQVARAALDAITGPEAEGADVTPVTPVTGIIGALLPLLDDCSVTIAISRLTQPSIELCAVVAPRLTEMKKQIPPHTVIALAHELESKLLSELPHYVTSLIGANAPEE